MKIIKYIFISIILTILVLIGFLYLENLRPGHFLDPVTRFLRNNGNGNDYVQILERSGKNSGMFEINAERSVVEARLKKSGFSPTNGTAFHEYREFPDLDSWHRIDQRLALYGFSIYLKFNKKD